MNNKINFFKNLTYKNIMTKNQINRILTNLENNYNYVPITSKRNNIYLEFASSVNQIQFS